jgi:hypothetical protein
MVVGTIVSVFGVWMDVWVSVGVLGNTNNEWKK